MSQIEIDQAKSRLEELIEQAARGEEIVITRNDRPVARLLAVVPGRRREFGSAKGKIWMSEDFDEPLEDFRDYM
ncbi:type II toxin-antitoxin system prevent-host-death family antitoxin [Rhodocaloribacter litoris]|uniref:type II toxin-antitoxin system Phd/YefM family antitoxin n=1 Tax=Rhodocaloribacter litoris TaxID=2558931 RepID=UPI00141E6378|nr:type II toxin-antitoxin system prevent-host-death family antitoxin [Rhodocaloribacter litoris]QXD17249.1 type II toxin-antitoxin system prevent-host-death family antitoxin [Rhodocaloribacter litoris]